MILVVFIFNLAISFGSCPSYMVPLQVNNVPICMDQYEAYVVQVFPNGTEGAWPFNMAVDNIVVRAKVAPSVKPQAYISADQGSAACKLAGKRLCTLAEWLVGCQGPNHNTYPYGNTYTPGYCNDYRPAAEGSPLVQLFGTNSPWDVNDPRLDQLPDTVSFTGQYTNCVSDSNIYDMSGNLDEWVSDLESNGHGIYKGGYFVDATINGPGCLYATTAHPPSYHDYSLGFRCCMESRAIFNLGPIITLGPIYRIPLDGNLGPV